LKSTRGKARSDDFSPWNDDRGQIVNSVAEKSAKKKTKKASKDASVLGTLPATRPTRLGGERRGTTTATGRPAAAAAANPSAASKPKASAAPATKSSNATKSKATAKAKATRPKKPKAVPQPPRTEAPPAGWQVPGDGRRESSPVGLATTAVQAAGELAQIGLTVTGQILRRAANRLPGR
jgi:hypothetical protein